jgi:DNA-binding beta-propeller fold protein YncE
MQQRAAATQYAALRIQDPRGLALDVVEGLVFVNSGSDRVLALDSKGKVVRDTGRIAGLNPGGGVFGPDRRYYLGSRGSSAIMGFSIDLKRPPVSILPAGIVPYARGFGFDRAGRVLLASGIGPNGEGDNTIAAFTWRETAQRYPLINDPELSPLDLLFGPNGNILVSSEYPFASVNAVTTIREYDVPEGNLVRVLSAGREVEFRKPRGLRFGPNGNLYCVAEGGVVAFDFHTGQCLGATVRWPRLNGQALAFVQ